MQINKKLLGIAAIPLVVGGWVLFRPELLFINQQVNEKAPVLQGKSTEVVASGMFESGAHETKGTAQLIRSGDRAFVRLSNFSTSNGPDVRVILLPQASTSETSGDAIDLGSLKGNQGDQNYEVPVGKAGSGFAAVSIWCQRFSVGFGRADLASKVGFEPRSHSRIQLASFTYNPIRVTYGNAIGNAAIKGSAAIQEDAGRRYVELHFKSIPKGYSAKLLKAETIGASTSLSGTPSIALGELSKGNRKVAISKEIDAWLYRSIAIVNDKTGKVDAFILLRSEQEVKKSLLLA